MRKEFPYLLIIMIAEELLRRTVGLHDSVMEQHDTVGHLSSESHLVGDDYHRHSAVGEFLDDVKDLSDHHGIQSRCRFIEEHDIRIHCKSTRYCHTLLLSSGELHRIRIRLIGKTDPLQKLIRFLRSLLLGHDLQFNRMQNGEVVRLSEEGAALFDFYGNPLPMCFENREKELFEDREEGVDDMLSEIRSIPASLRLGFEKFPKEELRAFLKEGFKEMLVLGCGSAYHAGLVFCEAMREVAEVCVRAEIASEFLTEKPCVGEGTLVIVVSQSGETADTLLAVERAKKCGAKILSVCNARASSLTRLSDFSLTTRCGRERAVAATKSYVSQAQYLLLICLEYADITGKTNVDEVARLRREISLLSQKTESICRAEKRLEEVALGLKNAEAVFFLGRKGDLAAAKEGSLKLKEVSYLFSEAYPSGELKHGTLALMEKGVWCVVVATDPSLLQKNAATLSEVLCRGASAVVITAGSALEEAPADYVVTVPEADPVVSPLFSAVVMQYFAYFAAKARGCDVDKPRNLAKSVTVE